MSVASQSDTLGRTRRGPEHGGTPSLRDIAYEKIKQRIITCALRPGEVLSEASISEAIKVGRTPVHQALDRLIMEGLVDVMPRKGVIVRPLSLDEVLDIIEVRLINETHCARLAAQHISLQNLKNLENNLDRFRRAAKQRDIVELMQLDREFHNTLSQASQNAVLGDLLRKLHDRSLRFWFISLRAPDHHQRVYEQHKEIAAAIRHGDAGAAEWAMRNHIDAFRSNVTRQI